MLLSSPHRQKDEHFLDVLVKVRSKQLDWQATVFLKSLSRQLAVDDGVLPTRLYAKNKEVDRENQAQLRALPGPDQRSLRWGRAG